MNDAPEDLLSAVEAIAEELHSSLLKQTRLQKTHELFTAVFEGTADLVFVKDVSSRYLMVNGPLTRALGRGSRDILGKTDLELMGPGGFERTRQEDRQVMMLGEQMTFESPVMTAEGTRHYVVTKGPYRNADGQIVGVFGTARDVTAEIQPEMQALKESVRAQENLLAVASHELKTPLLALKLHLENTRRQMGVHAQDAGPNTWLASRLEQGEKQVSALTRQVAELMDVTLAQAGRLTLNLERCDLVELLSGVMRCLDDEIKDSGSAVTVVAPRSLMIDGDGARLQHAVSNLVTNAIKYGRGQPIVIKLERRAGHARLTVQDHGPGIAREHRARIFERFERAVPNGKIPGTGLGLWILKEIVEAHQGRIRVMGRPGEGSCFKLVLPLEPATA